jgi:hypothetical protein
MIPSPPDYAVASFSEALSRLRQLRRSLHRAATDGQKQLMDELGQHVCLAFWQARLGQRITPGAVARTPFCRELTLGPLQSRHLDEMCRGMLAAERSLLECGNGAPPWNALIYGRDKLPRGMKRSQFEAGFVMRLYQMLHELAVLNRCELAEVFSDSLCNTSPSTHNGV